MGNTASPTQTLARTPIMRMNKNNSSHRRWWQRIVKKCNELGDMKKSLDTMDPAHLTTIQLALQARLAEHLASQELVDAFWGVRREHAGWEMPQWVLERMDEEERAGRKSGLKLRIKLNPKLYIRIKLEKQEEEVAVKGEQMEE